MVWLIVFAPFILAAGYGLRHRDVLNLHTPADPIQEALKEFRVEQNKVAKANAKTLLSGLAVPPVTPPASPTAAESPPK